MSNSVHVINAVIMDELREIMGGDFEFLITTYLSDSEKKICDMKSAFDSRDLERLQSVSHSLKGSSLNLGVFKLADTSNQIEVQAGLANIENLQELIHLLEVEFAHAKKAIGHFVK